MFISLVTVVHIFICISLIGIVLLQQGKGADMGATFGGGGGTVFGASGADTLLSKVTTVMAAVFMITSVLLAVDAKTRVSKDEGILFTGTENTSPAEATAKKKGAAPEARKTAADASPKAESSEGAGAKPKGEALASDASAGATSTKSATGSDAATRTQSDPKAVRDSKEGSK